ncbi:hypothetical protein P8452_48617 [Trifolium repens]|nr:hypothetical protein P8452_48617 [Trifolium repens]
MDIKYKKETVVDFPSRPLSFPFCPHSIQNPLLNLTPSTSSKHLLLSEFQELASASSCSGKWPHLGLILASK